MPHRLQTKPKSKWTFMTNHSHVLLCLATNPQIRAREIAVKVRITERAVLRILKDLGDDGFIEITKMGRCNTYRIKLEKSLKHPLEEHCKIGAILDLLKPSD